MTVLVKKVFISSKPSIVCLLCPPPCGPFSIQESAVGGLSYKVKKNVPWHILAKRLLSYGNEVSYTITKPPGLSKKPPAVCIGCKLQRRIILL